MHRKSYKKYSKVAKKHTKILFRVNKCIELQKDEEILFLNHSSWDLTKKRALTTYANISVRYYVLYRKSIEEGMKRKI